MRRNIFQILRITAQEWMGDKAPQQAAALAFYSLLSIGPIFLVAIALAGLVFGHEAATGQIVGQVEYLVGKPGAEALQTIIANSRKPSSNMLAIMFSAVTLVIGASGVFGQLQEALNIIWDAPQPKETSLWRLLKNRLLSSAMVLGVGFLLLVSLIVSAALAALGTFFSGALPSLAPVLELLNSLVTLGVVTALFAMIFKILPERRVGWREVWGGAALSAVLFTVGKYFIGLYLGKTAISSTYGAAGAFVVLTLWVYYSSLILFFGAELAYVYSDKFHGAGTKKHQNGPYGIPAQA